MQPAVAFIWLRFSQLTNQEWPEQESIVIGAERLSFYLDWSRRETAVLFGDGAGAVVVEATDVAGGVLGYELNNDPGRS